jgi:hypothetical protein
LFRAGFSSEARNQIPAPPEQHGRSKPRSANDNGGTPSRVQGQSQGDRVNPLAVPPTSAYYAPRNKEGNGAFLNLRNLHNLRFTFLLVSSADVWVRRITAANAITRIENRRLRRL